MLLLSCVDRVTHLLAEQACRFTLNFPLARPIIELVLLLPFGHLSGRVYVLIGVRVIVGVVNRLVHS